MKYDNTPNLLLESLVYLGRKASGNTWDSIDLKIKEKKIKNINQFKETFNKLKDLTNYIDKKISINDDILIKFFSNIEGFPFNTIGSTSIAFLIFYEVLEEFCDNFDLLIKKMKTFSSEEIAYNIADALDISDNYKTKGVMSDRDFINAILSLSIPAESKIIILDIYRNYHDYLETISPYIKSILSIFNNKISVFHEIINNFNLEISKIGCTEFLKQTSKLKLLDNLEYCLSPFIFGMDTLLLSDTKVDYGHIYCGILRKELLDMLNNQVSYIDEVYNEYHLLGDRTRFDILIYIRDNKKAYGQELSKHLNLSRNTIHHHMSKLINSGFVVYTTDGNRVYYSIDNDSFESFLNKQKKLFLN